MRAARDGREGLRAAPAGARGPGRGESAESQARGHITANPDRAARGRFPSNPDLLLRVSKKRLGVVNNKNKADFSYAFAPFSVSDDATFKIVFLCCFHLRRCQGTETGI